MSKARRWLRSLGAVLAGLLAALILSLGSDAVLQAAGLFTASPPPLSDWPYLLATGYRTLYAAIGGYVAARLAPHGPMRHAMALALFGLAAAVAGLFIAGNRPDLGPTWYPLAIAAITLPAVWGGGKLAAVTFPG